MTSGHAALQLLAHGPLTLKEFREITGWPPAKASRCLHTLYENGLVAPSRGSWYSRTWGLACG